MNGRWWVGIVLVIALIVGAAGLGAYAYNMGLMQGMAQADRLPAPSAGTLPYPYAGGPFFYRPWGFGFGFLGCLIPLFVLFIVFGVMRMVFWNARWGWRGHRGLNEKGVPYMFDEWHQKLHETK